MIAGEHGCSVLELPTLHLYQEPIELPQSLVNLPGGASVPAVWRIPVHDAVVRIEQADRVDLYNRHVRNIATGGRMCFLANADASKSPAAYTMTRSAEVGSWSGSSYSLTSSETMPSTPGRRPVGMSDRRPDPPAGELVPDPGIDWRPRPQAEVELVQPIVNNIPRADHIGVRPTSFAGP